MGQTNTPNWAERSGWWPLLGLRERQRVAAEVQHVSIEAGQPLVAIGQPATAWVGLVRGLAKFTIVTANGKPLAYSGIGAGAWFGEGTLIRRDIWRYEAHALRPSELALLPRDTFEWLLDRNIQFNHFILHQLNDRLELMTIQVLDDRSSGSDALVARTLRHLFHPLAGNVSGMVQVTQQEIGQLCGLSRQRVNQALQRLEADGVLLLRYGGIEVRDRDKLRDWKHFYAPRAAAADAELQEENSAGQ